MLMTSCGAGSHDSKGGTDSAYPDAEEEFHADNDIAMTVRSVADAIRVGETLDSVGYNFEGVLTDGIGRPLYTGLQVRRLQSMISEEAICGMRCAPPPPPTDLKELLYA